MHDALIELSDSSLALQKSSITLPAADKLIARQVEVFTARKHSNSEYYNETCQAVASGSFKGVFVETSTGKEQYST